MDFFLQINTVPWSSFLNKSCPKYSAMKFFLFHRPKYSAMKFFLFHRPKYSAMRESRIVKIIRDFFTRGGVYFLLQNNFLGKKKSGKIFFYNSCPRGWCFSTSQRGSTIGPPLKPLEHHSSMVSRGLSGTFNWAPIYDERRQLFGQPM